MTRTITTYAELDSLLKECEWKESAMFAGLYSKENGEYFEVTKRDSCVYGINHLLRCTLQYPFDIVDDFGPVALVYHKTIKHNNITIRLDE